MTARGNVAWHGLHAGEAVRLLATDVEHGRSESEATARLARFGPNKITWRSGPPEWKRFLLQFHAPLVYILLVAASVTAWLGERIDSSVIFGVVFINAIIGARLRFAGCARMRDAGPPARGHPNKPARRRAGTSCSDGIRRSAVPRGARLIYSGKHACRDRRLRFVRALLSLSWQLSGESVPVHKHCDPLALETILADRHNLAFAGTLATFGQGEGVVWATGDKTETGRFWLISEAEP